MAIWSDGRIISITIFTLTGAGDRAFYFSLYFFFRLFRAKIKRLRQRTRALMKLGASQVWPCHDSLSRSFCHICMPFAIFFLSYILTYVMDIHMYIFPESPSTLLINLAAPASCLTQARQQTAKQTDQRARRKNKRPNKTPTQTQQQQWQCWERNMTRQK